MSYLPPPGTTPYPPPPGGQPPAPRPGPARSRRAIVIGTLATVALLLAAVVGFVALRPDDLVASSATASGAAALAPVASVTPSVPRTSTTLAPATSTTLAPTTTATTLAPTTTEPPVSLPHLEPHGGTSTTAPTTEPAGTTPAGSPTAVALGFGVEVLVPPGDDAQTLDGGAVLLSTPATDAARPTMHQLEVAQRAVDETAVAAVQSAIDAFDGSAKAITYTAIVPWADVDGPVASYEVAQSYFVTDDGGIGNQGRIVAYHRADGLTLTILDRLQGDDMASEWIPPDVKASLRQSFGAAPLLGAPAPLPAQSVTQPVTAHVYQSLDQRIDISLPEGWTVDDSSDPTMLAISNIANHYHQVYIKKLPSTTVLADAEAAAWADLNTQTHTTRPPKWIDTPHSYGGFDFGDSVWAGAQESGQGALYGEIYVYANTTTGDVYLEVEAWSAEVNDPPSSVDSYYFFQAVGLALGNDPDGK